MDDMYDFNSEEWGDIVYEESTNNKKLRQVPVKRMGYLAVLEGVVDLLLIAVIFYLSLGDGPLSDLPGTGLMLVIVLVLVFALAMFGVGAYRLTRTVKPVSLLEKGIVEDGFKAYEEIPVIELKGPKDKSLILTRSGKVPISTDPAVLKAKKGFVRTFHTPDEYDYLQFAETLKKFGYSGKESEPSEAPKDDKGQAQSADGKKDGPQTTEVKKDESKPSDAPSGDAKPDDKK